MQNDRDTEPRRLFRPTATRAMTAEELMDHFVSEGSLAANERGLVGETRPANETRPADKARRVNEAHISLHDLLARGTDVHWDEAVAIVQELCDVLISAAGDAAAVPDLADVLIGKEGSVTARGNRGETSPTAAARLLHALLANADMPVPLRLFVSQATAPETYRSLRAFAEGLAYFGRPNRTELIQNVCKRAADLVRSSLAPAQASPPESIKEKTSEKDSPIAKRSNHRRELLWAAAGMLLLVAGGAAWGWLSAGSRRAGTGGAQGVLSQATAAFSDLANQVRERLSPPVSTTAERPDEASAPVSPPRPRRSPAPASVAAEALLAGRRLSIAQPNAWQLPLAAPSVAAPVPAAPVDEPAPVDTDRVFTRQDGDVEPPVLRFPQLTPPPVVRPSREAAVNSVEVVVTPEGTVERIRFVDGPIRMSDILLVQAVKNWRFTPALKDGEPVRYQAVISWVGAP
jgi:hypothetical protein